MKEIDPFAADLNRLRGGSGGGSSPKWIVPTLLIVVGFVAVGFLGKWIFLSGSASTDKKAVSRGELLPEDLTEREVSNFALSFLTNFFTLTPEVYPVTRRRVESMMTDTCLSAYKLQAYDRDFLNQMKSAKVSTDGFHFQDIKIAGEKNSWEAKVTGDISYTTLVNRKKGEFVVTMYLVIVKSPEGKWLVDNLSRLR